MGSQHNIAQLREMVSATETVMAKLPDWAEDLNISFTLDTTDPGAAPIIWLFPHLWVDQDGEKERLKDLINIFGCHPEPMFHGHTGSPAQWTVDGARVRILYRPDGFIWEYGADGWEIRLPDHVHA